MTSVRRHKNDRQAPCTFIRRSGGAFRVSNTQTQRRQSTPSRVTWTHNPKLTADKNTTTADTPTALPGDLATAVPR